MKPLPRVNILLVDDEETNLLALESILDSLGHNIVKARSGPEALRHVLDYDFAIILMDVQMGTMTGLEAAQAIHERERSRRIPIIFLTGREYDDRMMYHGYSIGAVDYLMKPINPKVLLAKVEVFCELAGMRIQAQEELTQSSKLNAELERKNTVLHEMISELESYSYSISHDMRAPLRAMQGYADVLIEEASGTLSEEHQGFLKRIHSVADRLDHLIADVLRYSQVARTEIKLEPIDVSALITSIREQYPEMQCPQADISIIGGIPSVIANDALLTQCISNLLGNAIKFVAPGVIPSVSVSAIQVNDNVLISFNDNGIGIAARDLQRIFGIFVKVHTPETYPGTGIGLSIVKKAVERLGGKVGVESKLGNGSTFWLELKAA